VDGQCPPPQPPHRPPQTTLGKFCLPIAKQTPTYYFTPKYSPKKKLKKITAKKTINTNTAPKQNKRKKKRTTRRI
ncbi:hypothetical protein ACTHS5_11250, partial [Neisseria sp. P0017.S002]|uniref:hypothetical protein n=1 Tax=Neisseria sp. P0017.S002 TaxID=3436778 RepID=UPI003F7FD06C